MNIADLHTEQVNGIVLARLEGEIDMSNADELRAALSAATSNDALALILDLTDVRYLDSAGLHLILRLRADLNQRGQELRLVVPDGSLIHHTLRLSGIRWPDDIVATAAAAREAFGV